MFIPPGYAELAYGATHTDTGQEALTAIAVHLEAADPATVITGAAGAWTDTFSTIISDVWIQGFVRMSIGTSDPSAPIVGELTFADWGNNTTDPCPPQVCTLLRKITASGGRKNRGRMYLPSPGEAGVDAAGNFSDTQHDDNQENATTFLETLQAIDGVTGVFLLHTDDDDDPTEIVGLTAVKKVATQRRRLR